MPFHGIESGQRNWRPGMGVKEVLPQVRRLANDVDGHVRYRATQAARDLEAR